jgi:hypothetical protein
MLLTEIRRLCPPSAHQTVEQGQPRQPPVNGGAAGLPSTSEGPRSLGRRHPLSAGLSDMQFWDMHGGWRPPGAVRDARQRDDGNTAAIF